MHRLPPRFTPLPLTGSQPEFNKHVEELVRESKAFKRNYKGAPLLSSVKAEVEAIVMSDAAAALWQVLSSPDKEFVPKLESCVLAALNTVHSERATH